MAKSIEMQYYNGSSYDIVYPKTIGSQVIMSNGKSLEESFGSHTYIATIGTDWTEDSSTGVKSQNVVINGILESHTGKVDHVYTGDGTSDGYAQFVEEENQYLTYITNGYAETYNGGITFYIFGDAPDISIPIVVEVV